jgi:hypothetical protein
VHCRPTRVGFLARSVAGEEADERCRGADQDAAEADVQEAAEFSGGFAAAYVDGELGSDDDDAQDGDDQT